MADKEELTLYREALLGRSWWQPVLLGIVLILAGLFMLRNAVAATVVTAIVFGVALLVAGIFEVIHSFWAPHWGGFLGKLLVGAFYAVGGAVLVADPLAASVVLTLVFAAAMFASGAVRMYLAVQDWHPLNALLFTSGIVGILASFVIVAKWPLSGLWVFGLMVGIDLLLHGIWWVVHGWTARHEPRPA
jgi:uncharacterized membrane protein HdeD (DUF308 family)